MGLKNWKEFRPEKNQFGYFYKKLHNLKCQNIPIKSAVMAHLIHTTHTHMQVKRLHNKK